MADRGIYIQTHNFTDLETAGTPTGEALDIEFANVATAGKQLLADIAGVRRSDGALVNRIVTQGNLAPGLIDDLASPVAALATEAEAAAAEASATQSDMPAAIDLAATSSAALAALAVSIAERGRRDYGLITDGPGAAGAGERLRDPLGSLT